MAQSAPAAAVSNIYNTPELRDKIVFTFLCLVIYRIGAHITAPGVDVVALTDFFANRGKGGVLGLYDLFVGGGLSKATVFALGIMPYISASIFMQIAGVVIPTVEKMQKDEEGRKKINQWTRYVTIALAIVQGWGFALFVSSLEQAVVNPGFGFKLQMVLILTTGAMFVMWLGEQITEMVAPGTWLYYVLSAGLIVFFTYFYTAIIFNPVDISENLKKQGGFIPGVKPGAKTAEYIEHVVSRITFPGAIFLTFIALLPVWLADMISVPFRFGGTSLLIVVGVALDTMAQVNQHLLLRKYDGFMKKGRVRFRGRQAGGAY